MRRVAYFLLGLVIAWSMAASPAIAQSMQAVRMPCHEASEIAKQLGVKYEEAPVAFGLQTNGNLLQIYTSRKKNTWTVVSTTPAGLSCIVAAGHRWENLPLISTDPLA